MSTDVTGLGKFVPRDTDFEALFELDEDIYVHITKNRHLSILIYGMEVFTAPLSEIAPQIERIMETINLAQEA